MGLLESSRLCCRDACFHKAIWGKADAGRLIYFKRDRATCDMCIVVSVVCYQLKHTNLSYGLPRAHDHAIEVIKNSFNEKVEKEGINKQKSSFLM